MINCGGLAAKNALLMQIYADITGRPMKVSRSDQTPALGAAIFGAIAAGKAASGYATVPEAQAALCGTRLEYQPIPGSQAVYAEMYKLYRQLHDGFGTAKWNGSMFNVMKDLLALRDRQRQA